MTETNGLSVLVSLTEMRMSSDAGTILCSMHEAKVNKFSSFINLFNEMRSCGL